MRPEETSFSNIRIWQRGQRGRSTAVRNCWVEDTALPLYGGGSVTELSVTDGCPRSGGDVPLLAHCEAPLLINIAHIQKINDLRGAAPHDQQRGPLVRWRAGRGTNVPVELAGTTGLAGDGRRCKISWRKGLMIGAEFF
jgi:hypothetical protein